MIQVFTQFLRLLKRRQIPCVFSCEQNDYEFAAGYCLEHYDDPTKYEMGTKDPKYNAEIWIPVRKKD